jgi:hypothetical protein
MRLIISVAFLHRVPRADRADYYAGMNVLDADTEATAVISGSALSAGSVILNIGSSSKLAHYLALILLQEPRWPIPSLTTEKRA